MNNVCNLLNGQFVKSLKIILPLAIIRFENDIQIKSAKVVHQK